MAQNAAGTEILDPLTSSVSPQFSAIPLHCSGGSPAGEQVAQPAVKEPAPEGGSSSFVAMSKFKVANGMTPEVKQAFVDRPHLVDDAPGFIRMEVISPMDAPDEIWLLTYWTDEGSYRTWHRGHTYRESHQGIPKGLRLDPKGTEIRFFEHVCS